MEAQREPDTTSSVADDHGDINQLSESRSSELDNSHVLSEMPVDDARLGPLGSAEVKVQTDQNTLERENTLAAQDQSQNQHLSPGLQTSSLESKALSATPLAELAPVSAFNWRKYGQKQVKSPQGSRSYYRCTYADCVAKKIECSDQSNHIIEIIAKGQHNHDPPKRTNCERSSRCALAATTNTMTRLLKSRNDKDSSSFIREIIPEMLALVETKGGSSSDSDSAGEIDVKEEHINPPESQKRTKKIRSPYLESLSNDLSSSKKAKVVVQAAGDVGISGDGYRWRKYGQKMVKGNPHPRNYYRCTSGGCPVRKHTEMAADNTSSTLVTYKGEHDHDMPLPKKKHTSPSENPRDNVATHALVENSQIEQTKTIKDQLPTTQCSIHTGDEVKSENLGLAEERAMESAQTLLSIGFKIKQL